MEESPALERVAARMISSSDSWVGGVGSEEMRRDWWRRERAKRGWEEGVSPADVRMGIRLVVSWIDFVGSV
jgi:hypothetical protein